VKGENVCMFLLLQEADLIISDLTVTKNRLKVVDSSEFFMELGLSILYKRPTQNSTNMLSFLLPFSWELWLGIFIAYITISALLSILSKFSPYEKNVQPNVFNQFNSLWFAVGSLMQQGSDFAPK